MKKILMLTVLTAMIFAGCQKADFDSTVTGEGLNTFTLNTPLANTIIALNAATPTSKVEISWTASKPGVDKVPTYKWVAALRGTGNLDAPLLEIASDNSGKDTKLTLTHKQLDDALKAKGIADGVKSELIWSVKADNGSFQLLSSDTRNITITRMKDGATTFILLGPASSGTVQAIDPNSTTQAMKFNWTKSIPAAGGSAMKYKVLFAERKLDDKGNVRPVDWTNPLFAVNADNSGSDSLASIVYKAISDSLTKKRIYQYRIAG
ncbi:SusE domain-containing protein [Paraflavitalea speifideaquila]|uniref:SusE domain-containing protein n=1 Tax=Paraflavitalea speifideaquila TaxID=3076558 RepID=UPI0028EEEED5|nr:SusE domain-containing protein [Paraflavitalea speifideiaquila]